MGPIEVDRASSPRTSPGSAPLGRRSCRNCHARCLRNQNPITCPSTPTPLRRRPRRRLPLGRSHRPSRTPLPRPRPPLRSLFRRRRRYRHPLSPAPRSCRTSLPTRGLPSLSPRTHAPRSPQLRRPRLRSRRASPRGRCGVASRPGSAGRRACGSDRVPCPGDAASGHSHLHGSAHAKTPGRKTEGLRRARPRGRPCWSHRASQRSAYRRRYATVARRDPGSSSQPICWRLPSGTLCPWTPR